MALVILFILKLKVFLRGVIMVMLIHAFDYSFMAIMLTNDFTFTSVDIVVYIDMYKIYTVLLETC